ncbi:MAG: START domain-containing protein [Spirochaetia bacterium]|nr:START domain-containing protein [Spirochaetia bacterium]
MIPRSLAITFCILISNIVFAEDGWELRKNEDGIIIYTRPVKDTPYSEFKANTKVKTSLFSILALWADPDTYVEWMFNCKDAGLLKRETKTALYAYIVSDLPWPLMNREDILFADTTQDPASGIITIVLTGKPDFMPPKPEMVRVQHAYGKVVLIPSGNGEIEVNFNFFMNPGGMIPASIANLNVLEFPFFTLKKMREVVKKKKYQETNFEFFTNYK